MILVLFIDDLLRLKYITVHPQVQIYSRLALVAVRKKSNEKMFYWPGRLTDPLTFAVPVNLSWRQVLPISSHCSQAIPSGCVSS
jgi:hypothetical protein